MRPVVGILVLIVLAIGIATYTSRMHPGDVTTAPEERVENTKPEASTPVTGLSPAKVTSQDADKAFSAVQAGAVQTTLTIDNRGSIVIELFPKAAPKTVQHILDLIKQNYYNGIKIHRVEPGLVVQMGDPLTKNANPSDFGSLGVGGHGSGITVPLEVAANLPNVTNSVGLARTNVPTTGDSQFYINLANNDSFNHSPGNPGYCVFGRVIRGMDLVPKLAIGDTIKSFTVNTP